MFLHVEHLLLASSPITRVQAQWTPDSPSPPSGPSAINDCGPAPAGDPLITIGDSRTTAGDDEKTVVGGTTLTAHSDGAYIIGKQTLKRGSQITVSHTTYSLARNGKHFVVNGQTARHFRYGQRSRPK